MQHFVSIQDLSRTELETLIDDAVRRASAPVIRDTQLGHICVASLFFENSTRTRVSFELAAKRLGAHHVNVDLASSSQNKGETVWDTVATLQAMGIDQLVVRTSTPGLPAEIALKAERIKVINAGEANLSHPSQALLDLVTLKQRKGRIDNLSIAIVGDIAHSRVARSFVEGATKLGCGDIRLVAPKQWQANSLDFSGLEFTDELAPAINDADVVMALRIQRERLEADDFIDIDDYRARYSLTSERLAAAKDDLLVMHPGPINRNVELSDAVADGPQSVIQQQVAIGVPARMAILSALAKA
ncbi:MAG: aspartate carbamoyltransferase catalytic subunit [Gammaproteobacteria bacterium]